MTNCPHFEFKKGAISKALKEVNQDFDWLSKKLGILPQNRNTISQYDSLEAVPFLKTIQDLQGVLSCRFIFGKLDAPQYEASSSGVKKLKKDLGVSTPKIALSSGLHAQTLKQLLAGEGKTPSIQTLMALAQAFEVSFILGGKDD